MIPLKKLIRAFELVSEGLLGIKMRPYQVEFAERVIYSVFNHESLEVVSLWTRQGGKTETIACVSMFLLLVYPKIMQKPIRIGIFAPKFEQANITFERIRTRYNYLAKVSPKYNVGRFKWGNSIEIFEGSCVRCISASEGTTIEGETFDLVITEETQDISNRKLIKSIFPMTAATGGTRVLIGTASFHKCYFWEATERLKGSPDGFFNDWKVVVKYNKKYQKHINKEISRIGEDSDEFRSQYCLEWRLEHGQFITHEKIMSNLMDESIDLVSDYEGKTFAGIDVAKSPDSTVVTIGILTKEGGMRILNFLELEGENYANQVELISAFLRKYNCKEVLVDKVGVGDPVVDLLKRMSERGTRVMGFRWSVISHHNAFKSLSYYIDKKLIKVPYGPKAKESRYIRKFIDQFSNLERRYVGSYMKCHHPDMPNVHDDYCSSISLLVWLALGRYHIGKILGQKRMKKDPIQEMQDLNLEVKAERQEYEPFLSVSAVETVDDKLKRLRRVTKRTIR